MRRHIPIVALVAAVSLGNQAAAAPKIGEPAPAVTAKTLDGQAFDLAKLRGHVVVVNVWATWCAPCRAEMPAIDAVYRRLHDRGLEVIGLSADKPRDKGKVRQVMADFSYPAALADQTRAAGLTATSSLPVTYVIDRVGRMSAVVAGGPALTQAALEALVTPLIEQAAP
jgi:cytochrome c biogenesis protein CcmG/thiol:disulfide interchange protein DsbE